VLDFGLEGRAAFVTGGSGGIGEGAAIALAQAGCNVAIGDIDEKNGERVAGEIRKLGREARYIAMNALEPDQVRAGVEAAASAFGRLDVLVNNIGGARPRPFLQQNDGNWRRVIDLNLVSMLAATQTAAPHMIKGGRGGAIVNVASSEGFRAAPMYSVYAACKAGMIEYTKTMALELAEHGIRMNCIAPDGIDTPGVRPPGTEGQPITGERSRHIPLGRWASIHEAGAPIAFLASDLASYVTGATLSVDGGINAAGGWIRSKDGTGWGFV
jgi:NAD(P)-dependent dehydrogenase (short-subunit alcohol dehydrogenase family)